MSAAALVADLKRRGVELAVHGERLRWRASKGVMNEEMIAVLRRRKPEVIALLTFAIMLHRPRRPALSPAPLTEVYPVAEGDEWLADPWYALRRVVAYDLTTKPRQAKEDDWGDGGDDHGDKAYTIQSVAEFLR